MPHHVYANNNEIATKSADGKSTAAAPDVCFTTPPSVAAGTPVPFTNTCEAKDITNGSKTVFMKRGEVALEDKSFFKKSTMCIRKELFPGKLRVNAILLAGHPM